MFPITDNQLDGALAHLGLSSLSGATIRQIVALSEMLEQQAEDPCVHLELGNPGIPASQTGIDAECDALRKGVAGQYPNISGIAPLKDAGSRFVKAFLDIDIPGGCIIPTVGSMQGTFTNMTLLAHRDPARDTMLFIYPGFPAQTLQAHVNGMKIRSFDLFAYRGEELERKLDEVLSAGDITGMIYSNPNNPAWTNFTEDELRIIGRAATKYDVVVLEDHAYMGMDYRTDLSQPGRAPFVPTVARYTDNYVLFLSASKIFSYAGQRIALACISPRLACRPFPALKEFFGQESYLNAYIFGVLYCMSSGTAHSAQYALAAMMNAAVDGKLDFVHINSEYSRRAMRTKELFMRNGFNLVYERDADGRPIGDGFFFTVRYGDMDCERLQRELMRYGIATIALNNTGSSQQGVRVCVSRIITDDHFDTLGKRLKQFDHDHRS